MEGFVSRSDLLSRERLRALSVRSDGRGLIQLAGQLGALIVTGWAISQTLGSWWVAPVWLAHGILLIFLFTAMHECIHRTAFRTRRLNDVVARVAGFLLILPAEYFRCFHYEHHRHTQDLQRDPELLGRGGAPTTLGRYLWEICGITSYWLAELRVRLRHARAKCDEPFIPESSRSVIIREARLHLLGYLGIAVAALALARPEPLYYWLIPAILGRPFLALYLRAEHTGCEYGRDMLSNTRTILTNPLVRALAWNMPWHIEHHIFPAVPFHALPKLYPLIAPRHGVLASGYIAFHRELIRDLKSAQNRTSVTRAQSPGD